MTPSTLQPHLDAVLLGTDLSARIATDPVAFPRRYTASADQEAAGVFSSALAYGRVAAFRPVLERLFAIADRRGGPHRWVRDFDPDADRADVDALQYRWNNGGDFRLLAAGLGRVARDHGSLEAFVPPGGDVAAAAEAVVGGLRSAVVMEAERCGVTASAFGDLPRGLRSFLPVPSGGSACKRWMMFFRWMVRSASDGVDLGLWTRVSPAQLIIPVDTHVLRISRFLGLTRRTDSSWRTAIEVTEGLKRLDADDPIRYDFAIAHLGISGACRGHRVASVCATCALDPVCTAE